MSYVVKEPTFIIGYNVNIYHCGFYEYKRSMYKEKMEKEIEDIQSTTPKNRMKIFDITEAQATNMKISLISIYPSRYMPEIEKVNENEPDDVNDDIDDDVETPISKKPVDLG